MTPRRAVHYAESEALVRAVCGYQPAERAGLTRDRALVTAGCCLRMLAAREAPRCRRCGQLLLSLVPQGQTVPVLVHSGHGADHPPAVPS